MAFQMGASLTICADVISSHYFSLSDSDKERIEQETQRRYREHLASCRKLGIEPSPLRWFCLHIAAMISLKIYEQPQPLTPINDHGIRNLLTAVFVRHQQEEQLKRWHARYAQTCTDTGLPAYSLRLLLDAVGHLRGDLLISDESPLVQAQRLNAIVQAYVKRTKRKDNPRWYARTNKQK